MKRNILNTVICLVIIAVACSVLSSCTSQTLSAVNTVYVFEGNINPGMIKSQPTQVEMNIDFPSVPVKLAVYQAIKPNIDDEYARGLAQKLGFVNEWPLYGGERQAYSFTKDNESLEIGLEGGLTFRREVKMAGTPPFLPEDSDCVRIAQDWLKTNDFYPENVIRIDVGYYGEGGSSIDPKTGRPGETIHYSKGVSFVTSLNSFESYVPSARVLVGDQGKIVQASIVTLTTKESGTIALKTPQMALGLLKEYMARLVPITEEKPECIFYTDGSLVVINKITVEYARSNKTDYVLPIYVFEGIAYQGTNQVAIKFIGLVDAVDHQ
jgi:hypothetical protein